MRLRLLVGTTSDEVWDVARFDEVQYVPEAGGGAAWGAGALLALAARARRGRPHAESSSG